MNPVSGPRRVALCATGAWLTLCVILFSGDSNASVGGFVLFGICPVALPWSAWWVWRGFKGHRGNSEGDLIEMAQERGMREGMRAAKRITDEEIKRGLSAASSLDEWPYEESDSNFEIGVKTRYAQLRTVFDVADEGNIAITALAVALGRSLRGQQELEAKRRAVNEVLDRFSGVSD